MSLLEDLSEGQMEIDNWNEKHKRVKRNAKPGETIEIIKTGEVQKVKFTFMGGVHIDNFPHFTSYLDNEYLVLEDA